MNSDIETLELLEALEGKTKEIEVDKEKAMEEFRDRIKNDIINDVDFKLVESVWNNQALYQQAIPEEYEQTYLPIELRGHTALILRCIEHLVRKTMEKTIDHVLSDEFLESRIDEILLKKK
jgi:hypothetical protein